MSKNVQTGECSRVKTNVCSNRLGGSTLLLQYGEVHLKGAMSQDIIINIINLKDSPTERFSDQGGLHITTISQSTKTAEKRQGKKEERRKEAKKV